VIPGLWSDLSTFLFVRTSKRLVNPKIARCSDRSGFTKVGVGGVWGAMLEIAGGIVLAGVALFLISLIGIAFLAFLEGRRK
jgi:hypothetical protein